MRNNGQVLLARVAETGFAAPADASLPERTSDEQYRLLSVPGLEQRLQYFEVDLTSTEDADTSELLVFSANHPPLSEADLGRCAAALAAHVTGKALVFLRQARTGWADATCSDDTDDELAAVAVAAVLVICGWDESSRIVIDLGQRELEVTPERLNKEWFFRVQPKEQQ